MITAPASPTEAAGNPNFLSSGREYASVIRGDAKAHAYFNLCLDLLVLPQSIYRAAPTGASD
jgi:hypothetical protein